MKININIDNLTPAQNKIAKAIINTPASETKYYVIRAARQSGKSFLNEIMALYWALSAPNIIVAFINALHKQNDKIFESMINWIPPEVIRKAVKGDNRAITFINNSKIQFYTASSDSAVVGSSFDYMICDEFALWRQSAWTYIKPTVSAKQNAKVIISSTPRGKNQFYDACMKGQSNDPFYQEFRMSYLDNPYYDVREVEDAKNSSSDFAWRQEYLSEFIFGKSAVFGDISKNQKINKWLPYDHTKRYFVGIDFAGDGEDATVICIIDEDGNVAYMEEIEATTFPNQVRQIIPIIKRYKAEGFGETNGLGGPMVDMIQEQNINLHDFITSNQSKQQLVSTFIKGMHDDDIKLPTVELCSKLDNEMSTYIAKRTPSGAITYSHDKGLHDDYVDALLIAYYARKQYMFGGQDFMIPSDAAEFEYYNQSLVTSLQIEDLNKLSIRQLNDLEDFYY